jgi:general secretion pathway protein G
MVVIVIIGLLAGAVTIGVRSYLIAGKQSVARMEISKICQALDTYYSVFDKYPSTEEGIAVLAEKNEKLADALLSKLPTDPWGRPYEYMQPGRKNAYEVICYGADGREGGEGADRDMTSDNLSDHDAKSK